MEKRRGGGGGRGWRSEEEEAGKGRDYPEEREEAKGRRINNGERRIHCAARLRTATQVGVQGACSAEPLDRALARLLGGTKPEKASDARK